MPTPSYDEATALRALLGSTPDLIFFLDEEGRYRFVGATGAAVIGERPDSMAGKTTSDFGLTSAAAARFHEQRLEVMRTGRSLRDEATHASPGGGVILDYVIAPVMEDGRCTGVVVVARDVTERRHAESHARFLSDLNQTLQPLTDPDEIMAATARLLGEHLRADRCAYAQVEEDEDHFVITGDYAPNTFSIVGRFALSSFGPAHQLALEGKPYIVENAETDPRLTEFRASYRQTEIAAVIQVTLKKAGRFVAGMSVHQKVPRRWRADEIELVQVVVNRCWESLERARAARLLEVSEVRYRSLIRILTSIVWTVDATGAFITEQPSWGAYTGQTREQYAGFGWTEALHPDDRAPLLAVWQEAARTRTIYRTGGRLWHAASNGYRWFEVAAVPLIEDDGNLREWIGTVSDVHERREAQEHLANQRTWLEAVLDSLPVPVVFIEPVTANVRFANRAAQHATGGAFVAGQPPGMLHRFEITGTDGQKLADDRTPAVRLARGERLDGVQVTLHMPEGARSMLMHGDLLPPMHGHSELGVIAFQDITALKEIEDELRRANRLKDEFLATVSHELRTPLTAIIGWAMLLNDEPFDSATGREALKVIEQNARAQARLIEDLVDVSRIVAGKLSLDTRPVVLAEVVRAAVASVQPAIDAKDIALVQRLDDKAMVLGDAARLQQVVWNLISNAVRFTSVRGRIDVTLARSGTAVEIAVTDTGEGIEPDFLPHVFER
ncbi:MAG TPA: PAS domain-containing protein, partial [Thermoanaerobaculia bacterium]|nr:PAS domain-containing protein [Thermoanaerobaculia bacterium]